jgi:hypothetical protein
VKNHSASDPTLAPSARKPYEKPSIKIVPLRPDEAVLGNCKMGVPGPLQSNCSSPTACSTIAS